MQVGKCEAQATVQALPDYETPPINEVVCGLSFRPIAGLLVPHFGLLWDLFRAQYPKCEEAPPLMGAIEQLPRTPLANKPEFVEVPPLPRVWFVSSDGNAVIQVQRDRFLHNWRKRNDLDEYPRYDAVFTAFAEKLRIFRTFIFEQGLGPIEPLQYEMSYINHIPQGRAWLTTCDTGNVFRDFSWCKDKRFLPCPEAFHWRTSFIAPSLPGRLHVTIGNALSSADDAAVCILDLTVRGIGEDKSLEKMKDWFDKAREWIVEGFTDLTVPDIQSDIWGRKR